MTRSMVRYGRQVWRTYRDYLRKDGSASPSLLHASLDLTYQCNLRCNMCFLYGEHLDGGAPTLASIRQRHELTLPQWMDVLSQLWGAGVRSLVMTGGEVFTKKSFLDILAAAKDQGFRVSVLSNGTLIKEEDAERLVRIGPNFLRFSLDGDRETHDAICGRPTFDALMSSIDAIRAHQGVRGAGLPVLGFETVIQRRNQGQLSRIVEIAHEKGVRNITMSNVFFVPGREERRNALGGAGQTTRAISGALYDVDVDALDRELEKAKDFAESFGITLTCRMDDKETIHDIYHEPSFSYLNKCLYPWMVARINPYGDLIPCCGSTRTLGNLLEHPFTDLWNAPAYRTFRQDLKRAKLFPECVKCNTLADRRFTVWNWLPRF